MVMSSDEICRFTTHRVSDEEKLKIFGPKSSEKSVVARIVAAIEK
jgi:hypothetical protein